MQISTKDVATLIILTSIVFLIAPLFLIIYISWYNRRKKKHAEEKVWLRKTFDSELLKTQMEVQEQTLQTVAYDLHDNIGQILSLTAITLTSIDVDDRPMLSRKIEDAGELIKRSITELRQLSRLLHGEELVKKGLVSAVEFELEWLNKSERYQLSFVNDGFVSVAGQRDNETIIFRLFQEIINNAIRHANATVIHVAIVQIEKSLTLTITDNGKGFDVAEALKQQGGMGLHNIQKRTAMLNGSAQFDSAPGMGTMVQIIIPYPMYVK
ncbi:sensor histidine kinase [Mucilaginibacter lappiensis]|uniref:Oxygen sensor histidine kinase NreB n=1 Tax=Mucilaginibacter lappiensis TaxID=354630 RepID=A0A841JGY6_9SPHI|nr:ATP-binding protein [Mucilaginibacter lappiensis]MBB6127301.1 hypothetical protein [Mucilaginibacter lappiensis]